jgi:Tfp pilus assembly protein PilN
MFTFLFGDYRRKIKRDYRFRLLAIRLSLLVVLLASGLALSIPTYVILDSKLNAALLEKTAISNVTVGSESGTVKNDVSSIRRKLEIIKTDNEEIPISAILERIMSKRTVGIRINSISLKRKTEAGSIMLAGIAETRDGLVVFSKNLQSDETFTNVNLPVSSLTRNKDVPFSIIIDSKI